MLKRVETSPPAMKTILKQSVIRPACSARWRVNASVCVYCFVLIVYTPITETELTTNHYNKSYVDTNIALKSELFSTNYDDLTNNPDFDTLHPILGHMTPLETFFEGNSIGQAGVILMDIDYIDTN